MVLAALAAAGVAFWYIADSGSHDETSAPAQATSWRRAPLPTEYSKSTPVAREKWDSLAIEVCQAAMRNGGALAGMDLIQVRLSPDQKSSFYVFTLSHASGPHYVFQVDNITRKVIARYFQPDV